jgi:hypothetical protein
MAEVYRQVDTVCALNSKHVAMLLDVDRYKLITNLRCVLSGVGKAKLRSLHELFDVLTMV